MPILLKLFQKVEEEGTFPNSFYYASITLISKLDKYTTRKSQANIFYEDRCKSFQQNTSNGIQHHIKWIIDNDQVDFIPGMQDS